MHITTAAELDQMTPEERQADFEASTVRDLAAVDPRELAEVRELHTQRLRRLGHDITTR